MRMTILIGIILCLSSPTASDAQGTLKFAVYGDNRSGDGRKDVHRRLLRAIQAEGPAFILHTGDLVYRGDNEDHWNQFFEDGESVFSSVPFFPAKGNHDNSKANRFGKLFPLGKKGKNYYAFQYGPASLIALDTTIDVSPGSDQYQFLKSKLEEWKGRSPLFVFFHHPPFNGGKHGPDERVLKHLVSLFEDYGVDIVFAGHDHNYQRIGPINGVLYIVTGGGGGPLYRVRPNPLIQKYRVLFHYVSVKLLRNKIGGWMKTPQGAIEDSFEIDHTQNPIPKDRRVAVPPIPASRFQLFD